MIAADVGSSSARRSRCPTYAGLPVELAEVGTRSPVGYFVSRPPAAVVADPVFDPEMPRLRC